MKYFNLNFLGIWMVAFAIGPVAYGQHYKPVPKNSTVSFSVKHYGLSTEGTIGGLRGIIFFDPEHLEESSFEMSIEASTIFTGNRERDEKLKSKEYFYIEQFPTIYLISSNISRIGGEGNYLFEGDLLIRGITKHIKFFFTARKERSGYLFKGEFNVERKDFMIGESNLFLSNTVKVYLNIAAIKK